MDHDKIESNSKLEELKNNLENNLSILMVKKDDLLKNEFDISEVLILRFIVSEYIVGQLEQNYNIKMSNQIWNTKQF